MNWINKALYDQTIAKAHYAYAALARDAGDYALSMRHQRKGAEMAYGAMLALNVVIAERATELGHNPNRWIV